MNEKRKILQCLIDNRAFAPSASALAKDLGYESNKATLYRIIRNKTKDSTVDEVWNKLLEEHCLTETHLYNLARIFEGASYFSDLILPEMNRKHPEWTKNLLVMLVMDMYDYCSPTFQQETAPVLKDLKADEPDVYWGIVTVIYMRCRQIGPYKLGIKRTFHLLIDELDGMLFQWYPERADAHETAFNLKGLSYGTNLWKIIEYCVILFRRYTEADFSKYASQIMRLFNWGEVSYWRIPGCPYRQGSEVWLFSEQSLGRATNGFYIVLRLEAGKDNRTFLLKDALNYCFWTIDQDGEPPILQASRGASTHKEWCFYLYEYDEENSLLHLDANPDTGNLFGLPETLQKIHTDHPQGKDEKVWSIILRKWEEEQGEAVFQQAKERLSGRIELNDTYRVKDVCINRTSLTLSIEQEGRTTDYRMPIETYDFLADIHPAQNVLIVKREEDGRIYVEWPDWGYGIPLSEFSLVR